MIRPLDKINLLTIFFSKMKFILSFIIILSYSVCVAQKFTSEKNRVSFFSSTKMEDINAWNEKSLSIFNLANGDIAISIPVAQFEFDKSLMKEHFNEKYMESEKYPRAKFQGTITGFDPAKAGVQIVNITGKLTLHGQTNHVTVKGTLEKTNDVINAEAKFIVKLDDYKITIPRLLWQNIAEQVEITASFTYKPLE